MNFWRPIDIIEGLLHLFNSQLFSVELTGTHVHIHALSILFPWFSGEGT